NIGSGRYGLVLYGARLCNACSGFTPMKLNPHSCNAQLLRARKSVKSPHPQLRSDRKPYSAIFRPAVLAPLARDSGKKARSGHTIRFVSPVLSPFTAILSL